MEELKKYLEGIAEEKRSCDREDFNAYEWYGGNIDDAYEGGYDHGKIALARGLLREFFNKQ